MITVGGAVARPDAGVAAPVNYLNDLGEPGEHDLAEIYGQGRYRRPVDLDRDRDPDNVFRLNQNILPSS